MAGGFFSPDGKFQSGKWSGLARPRPQKKAEAFKASAIRPLCVLTPCVDQVRGAASTVWRSGVEGLLVATAGARGVGACAIGWLAI